MRTATVNVLNTSNLIADNRAKSILASCYGLTCDPYMAHYKALQVRLFQASLVDFQEYDVSTDCLPKGDCIVCCDVEVMILSYFANQQILNRIECPVGETVSSCYSIIDKTLRNIEDFTEEFDDDNCIIPVVTIEEVE